MLICHSYSILKWTFSLLNSIACACVYISILSMTLNIIVTFVWFSKKCHLYEYMRKKYRWKKTLTKNKKSNKRHIQHLTFLFKMVAYRSVRHPSPYFHSRSRVQIRANVCSVVANNKLCFRRHMDTITRSHPMVPLQELFVNKWLSPVDRIVFACNAMFWRIYMETMTCLVRIRVVLFFCDLCLSIHCRHVN